jgi:hypothetical protein
MKYEIAAKSLAIPGPPTAVATPMTFSPLTSVALGPLVAAGALAVTLLATACGATPDLVSRVNEMVETHNAHDVEGQLALFADGARIVLPDRSVIEGKAATRRLLEWDAALRNRIEHVDLEVNGDTVVTGTSYEESDWLVGAGIGRVEHEPGTRFVFRGNRIAELRFAPLVDRDLGRAQQAIGEFVRWAAEARPDLLDVLMPGNRFVYSADAARTWIEALQVWRESEPPAY